MRFVISQETEIERIINILAVTMTGFFERNNFVLVPELTSEIDATIQVVLPRLNYQSIPGFWQRVELLNRDIPVDIEQVWKEKLRIILGLDEQKFDDLCCQFQKEWGEIEEPFFTELERDFPGIRNRIGDIYVRISEYGTVSSGTWGKEEGRRDMHFYLRTDRGLGDLASMLVNLVLLEKKEELGITWSKREALMDYIMTRPAMKKLFPDFRPLMSQLHKVMPAIRLRSSKYLNELHIPRIVREIDVTGGKVVINGKVITCELGKKESELIKLFLKKEGEIATYDEISDALWGEGEFRSYWAINKMVERVRRKLTELGVDVSPLRPVRAQGYMWESR